MEDVLHQVIHPISIYFTHTVWKRTLYRECTYEMIFCTFTISHGHRMLENTPHAASRASR